MLTIQTHCCGETVTLENCVVETDLFHCEPWLKSNAKCLEITAITTITGECPLCHKKHEEIINSKTEQV